jgi:hypothetical protein
MDTAWNELHSGGKQVYEECPNKGTPHPERSEGAT